jgi:hypothetical protein
MAGCEFDDGTVEIRRSMSTAKVKGEAMQEKVRWFILRQSRGRKNFNPAATNRNAQGMEREKREWKEKCPQSRLEWYSATSLANCATVRNRMPRVKTGAGASMNREGRHHARAQQTHLRQHVDSSQTQITEVSDFLGHADVAITMKVS